MGVTGGCHCGVLRYEATGDPVHNALCCCTDCRRAAGAAPVGWAPFPNAAATITGTPARYASSPGTARRSCGACGGGLFYRNESCLPGQVDNRTGTPDDPDALPPGARIQTAAAPKRAAHGEPAGIRALPGRGLKRQPPAVRPRATMAERVGKVRVRMIAAACGDDGGDALLDAQDSPSTGPASGTVTDPAIPAGSVRTD